MREAIEFHLEGMRVDEDPIPIPSTTAAVIEVGRVKAKKCMASTRAPGKMGSKAVSDPRSSRALRVGRLSAETRPSYGTNEVKGATYACSVTKIPTKQPRAKLWKNT